MKIKTNVLWTRVAVVALALTVILAACGPAATTEAPTPVPPTPVPPTAIPATAVPPTAVPPTEIPPTEEVVDPAYVEGIPEAVIPAGEPGKPMITAAYNTIIRSGPGTNYVVYGAFLGSQTAIAVGISADGLWYAISVPVAPDGTGWVNAAFSIPTDTGNLPVLPAPPVPPSIYPVPPEAGDPQATALTEVYIRTGPGETYPAYGIAPAGSNARVIGKSEDGAWLVVRLDPTVVGAGYGWVATAYTQPSNIDSVTVIATPDVPPAVETTPPAEGVPAATAIDYIYIRSGPGTEYLAYGMAAPGATGEVAGKSEDGAWWQVKVSTAYVAGGLGWVSADWVTTVNTENVPVVPAPPPPSTEVPTTPPATITCVLVSQDPEDYTVFPPSTGFGMTWVLQNTGTTSWDAPNTNLTFLGALNGQRLHQGGDSYGMTESVVPGDTYTVSGSLITPADPGQYGEAWALITNDGTTLCQFWVLVTVE